MGRMVMLDEISDGRKYHKDSMVKIGCDGCNGKSICCHEMCDTIILDPYDIYELTKNLGIEFNDLLQGAIELNVQDGVIMPNIKKQPHNNGCGYLDDAGRCSIHDFRPGFCRLFPLGRGYEDDNVYYVNQVAECHIDTSTKVKVKNWLSIENIAKYEAYALSWHKLIKKTKEMINNLSDDEVKNINLKFINIFYLNPYDINESFYDQIDERIKLFLKQSS